MIRSVVLVLVIASIVGVIGIIEAGKNRRSADQKSESLTETLKTPVESTTEKKVIVSAPSKSAEKSVSDVMPRENYLTPEQKAARYKPGRELGGISGYFNLPAGETSITLNSIVGKKIILVDFWTYSCINCQRTIPYINAWYKKYADQGLEIIGVHTPEFAFEKDPVNVKAAIDKFAVEYPVVQDNDFTTWSSYENRYWPRKYLIDIDGYIVYDHIGEGSYAETERKIQELLAERRDRLGLNDSISREFVTPAHTQAVAIPTSPEIYFGGARNASYLANGSPGVTGEQNFVLPGTLSRSRLYLSGRWSIASEYAENLERGAAIVFNYTAQKVFFVARANQPVIMKVLRNGKPLTAIEAGSDVIIKDGVSTVTIEEARLYHLINESTGGFQHLELIPEREGLNAFTFTFG